MTKQRIVVVTGGGSGIGAEISYKFAKNGDLVYILGRNLNKLKVVAKKHQNIVPERVDITDPSSVEAARRRIAEAHPNVDVLVNCAGGNTKIDPDVSLEEANSVWSSIINANLTGTFNMIFAFLPHIERPGGRIINVTSLAAFVGSSQGAANGQAYAAAKSGVHGLSRTLANSISQEGITVNCVAPGVIDHTEFFGSEGLSEERRAVNTAKTLVGRIGEPQDIAGGVFFLASNEAGFITGEILNINGGVVFGR